MALTSITAARLRALPRTMKDRLEEHSLIIVAAGVAFYGFLALVPALVVVVAVYGLFADPADIERQIRDLTTALPDEAQALIVSQVRTIAESSGGSVTLAAVFSTVVALWSASAAMMSLMRGVALANETVDDRNFAAKRGIAIGMTAGAAGFVVISIAAIAFLPAALSEIEVTDGLRTVINLLRLPITAALLMVGLGLLFHLSEPRSSGRPKIVTWGTIVGAGLWLVGSIGFSFFAANFGSYSETYGSLGSIVVMLLWLWLSALSVLAGAEIESAWSER